MPDVTGTAFKIVEVERYERPVELRLPFRFGVVTLTQCPQAFARVRIELPDGKGAWGVTKMAHEAYLSDATAATAFGHFARHHDAHCQAAAAQGFNPLLASYGPALLDRAVLDALCRSAGTSFYQAVQGNVAGIGTGRAECSTCWSRCSSRTRRRTSSTTATTSSSVAGCSTARTTTWRC